MNKIQVESGDTLYEIINYLKSLKGETVFVNFTKGNKIYLNANNLRILKKIAEENDLNLKFEVENEAHKEYIDAVNNDVWENPETKIEIKEPTEPGKLSFKQKLTNRILALSFLSKLKKEPKGAKSKSKKGLLKFLIFILVAVALTATVLFFLWKNIPSATVSLTVDSEILIKLLEARASTETEQVSKEDSTIPAFNIEVTEESSETTPATGEKETGEFAEGKITLFNKTDDEIKIKKGTTVKLISSNKESLKYETVEEVKVPEQEKKTTTDTEGEKTEVIYGTKEVKIKAVEFGSKYNLEKGQNFEINDYDTDELIGENEDKITGGSLETVTTVKQEDLDKLKISLEELLKNKVKESLNKKIVEGQSMPESSVKYEILKTEYDKAVDEEAENVTLTMQVKAQGLAYSTEDLDDLVGQLITEVVPPEYSLNTENPEYEVAVLEVSEDGTNVLLQIKLTSYVTPTFSAEQIQNDLAGMTIEDAQAYLDNLSNVNSFEIRLSPKMPGPFRRMPQKPSNIVVETNQ